MKKDFKKKYTGELIKELVTWPSPQLSQFKPYIKAANSWVLWGIFGSLEKITNKKNKETHNLNNIFKLQEFEKYCFILFNILYVKNDYYFLKIRFKFIFFF